MKKISYLVCLLFVSAALGALLFFQVSSYLGIGIHIRGASLPIAALSVPLPYMAQLVLPLLISKALAMVVLLAVGHRLWLSVRNGSFIYPKSTPSALSSLTSICSIILVLGTVTWFFPRAVGPLALISPVLLLMHIAFLAPLLVVIIEVIEWKKATA